MTPQARLSAAAEVLDLIARSRAPADAVLREWGRAHRFAGSGDRRAIAERVYACLRGRARFAWRMQSDDGRALVLGALAEEDTLHEIELLFTGDGYAPAPLTDAERTRLRTRAEQPAWVKAGIPEWLAPEFQRAFGADWIAEAHALTATRAPVDLRVNTLKATREAVEAELDAAGVQYEQTHLSTVGLRLHPETDVQKLAAYREGRIEIQDESSQIAVWLSGAAPGMTVVDYCAGGGGKTLALATLLNTNNNDTNVDYPNPNIRHPNTNVRHPGLVPGPAVSAEALRDAGSRKRSHHPNSEPIGRPRDKPGVTEIREGQSRIVACDVDRARLDNIKPRLARAGVTADLRHIGPNGEGAEDLANTADLVFVDAPCSGSGTWRRAPEAPWRLTPADLDRYHALQRQILTQAAALVRHGGRLLYATCSVLPAEDEAIADAFAAAHPDFRPVPVAQALQAAPNLGAAARARLASLAGEGHMLRLSPRLSGTDGFFIALYQRTAHP